MVSATQCIRHTGVVRALKFRRRLMPRRAVGTSMLSSDGSQALVGATQCMRHVGIVGALEVKRRLVPRRVVGTSVKVQSRGQSGFSRALAMPRRARGGQQVSAAQSDNGRDHRVRREKSTITENLASRTPVHPMVIRLRRSSYGLTDAGLPRLSSSRRSLSSISCWFRACRAYGSGFASNASMFLREAKKNVRSL